LLSPEAALEMLKGFTLNGPSKKKDVVQRDGKTAIIGKKESTRDVIGEYK